MRESAKYKFEKDGYALVPGLVSTSLLADIATDISGILHDAKLYPNRFYEVSDEDSVVQIAGTWRTSDSVRRLVFQPSIADLLCSILGREARLLTDSLVHKTPLSDNSIPPHQDYTYLSYTKPMCHVTMWIPIQPTDRINGGMYYFPGSHHRGLIGANQLRYEHLRNEQSPVREMHALRTNLGDVVIHHPLVVHGSFKNWSNESRTAITLQVSADGVRAAEVIPDDTDWEVEPPAWLTGAGRALYDPDEEPTGPRLHGQFFPLLSRAWPNVR